MLDRRTVLGGLLAAASPTLSFAQAAGAAAFPTRPVRIVVPYAPGGITDSMARLVAGKLQERWGQPVVVDNKAGASGAIGAEFVAKAPADGYTLMASITSMLQAPILDTQLRFDLERDFAPLAMLGTSALVVVASNGMGVQTVSGLTEALKAAPKKYNYGTIGAGSSLHLYADQLARRLAVQPTHLPFKGAGPLVTEMLADRVDFAFLDFMTTRQHIEAGRIRAIAVTGTRRSALFPAVPTLEESGLPGFETLSWMAMFAPKGTPAALLNPISADVAQVVRLPEVARRFGDAGLEPRSSTPEELARMVSADRQVWSRLIGESRARPQ